MLRGDYMKKCNSCNQVLPLEKFNKNKHNKDGYENKCSKCRYEARKKYINTCENCGTKFKTARKQTKYCNKVYVITGTIVTNTPNSKIAVPSMFYKAIIGIHNNRKVVSCAWLYNNINDKQSIENTKMPIDKLESILGFDLFPELNRKDKSIEKKIFYF